MDRDLTPTTEAWPPPRKNWPTRLAIAFWNFGKRTVMIRDVGLVILFIGLGFIFVVTQINTVAVRSRAVDARAASFALYQTQLNAYYQAESAYHLCLDSVARSDVNRAQWEDLAAIIEGLEGGGEYAERIRQGPLLSSVPRDAAECPVPGDIPQPPG